ncbi:MAG TPA: AsmA-like C-terminal region-containing protein [Vicinamibacterales bacterium]|nr:AsmA-like C-terminal region-containing protein [Vicinamibacterales bacterium]
MRRILLISCAIIALAIAGLATWAVRSAPQLRGRVVDALNARFESQLALGSLDTDVFPKPRAAGTNLTLRHNGRTDVPPLITIDSFETSAALLDLTRTPVRLDKVAIQGLAVRMPPGGLNPGKRDEKTPHVPHAERPSPILIDRIEARSARVEIHSRRPDRLPRTWDIQNLVMRDFGAASGSPFTAGLINPVPRGVIDTTGAFGPWHADEPGLTPVSGNYLFQNADMNVIKGLGGTLSSSGTYRGVLERIEVEGTTEMPDFSLDLAGQKVILNTRFKAIVDGTNGDTILERVDAKLNESAIVAKGAVVRAQDVKGRHVELDVILDKARLEDLMQLAVKAAKPPLVGQVNLTTHMVLPAGPEDVVDRLQLDGRFELAQARFTNLNVQRRITTLSRRGRGEESDEGAEQERVVSNLRGRFKLANGALTFSELTFAVPGSTVRLHGSYDLNSQVMNFEGDLLTDATLADMTSGVKSFLARLAQPLFRRQGGGTQLPIRISGTRSKPQFGLDFGRVF